MQALPRPAVTPPVASSPDRARTTPTAPVLLDPQQLRLVAGGAPKGTWSAPASVQAPKGTW
jgi:hypothetical protein